MHARARKRTHVASVTIAVAIALGTLGIAEPAMAQQTGTIVVAARTSLLRPQPSAEAKVILKAGRGTEFAVTGSTGGWVRVALAGGGEGWLPRAEVGLKVNRSGGVCVEMALKDALTVGAVDGVFEGTGSSSGDSVTLRAKAALKLSVCPQVQAGTVLASANAAAQNMVLVRLRGVPSGQFLKPAVELRFEPDLEAEYVFEAYCLNFEKDNPSDRDRFTVGGTAPDAVLRILKVPGTSVEARQLAIWAVTDNISVGDARDKFGATAADIGSARGIIKSAGLSVEGYRLFSGG